MSFIPNQMDYDDADVDEFDEGGAATPPPPSKKIHNRITDTKGGVPNQPAVPNTQIGATVPPEGKIQRGERRGKAGPEKKGKQGKVVNVDKETEQLKAFQNSYRLETIKRKGHIYDGMMRRYFEKLGAEGEDLAGEKTGVKGYMTYKIAGMVKDFDEKENIDYIEHSPSSRFSLAIVNGTVLYLFAHKQIVIQPTKPGEAPTTLPTTIVVKNFALELGMADAINNFKVKNINSSGKVAERVMLVQATFFPDSKRIAVATCMGTIRFYDVIDCFITNFNNVNLNNNYLKIKNDSPAVKEAFLQGRLQRAERIKFMYFECPNLGAVSYRVLNCPTLIVGHQTVITRVKFQYDNYYEDPEPYNYEKRWKDQQYFMERFNLENHKEYTDLSKDELGVGNAQFFNNKYNTFIRTITQKKDSKKSETKQVVQLFKVDFTKLREKSSRQMFEKKAEVELKNNIRGEILPSTLTHNGNKVYCYNAYLGQINLYSFLDETVTVVHELTGPLRANFKHLVVKENGKFLAVIDKSWKASLMVKDHTNKYVTIEEFSLDMFKLENEADSNSINQMKLDTVKFFENGFGIAFPSIGALNVKLLGIPGNKDNLCLTIPNNSACSSTLMKKFDGSYTYYSFNEHQHFAAQNQGLDKVVDVHQTTINFNSAMPVSTLVVSETSDPEKFLPAGFLYTRIPRKKLKNKKMRKYDLASDLNVMLKDNYDNLLTASDDNLGVTSVREIFVPNNDNRFILFLGIPALACYNHYDLCDHAKPLWVYDFEDTGNFPSDDYPIPTKNYFTASVESSGRAILIPLEDNGAVIIDTEFGKQIGYINEGTCFHLISLDYVLVLDGVYDQGIDPDELETQGKPMTRYQKQVTKLAKDQELKEKEELKKALFKEGLLLQDEDEAKKKDEEAAEDNEPKRKRTEAEIKNGMKIYKISTKTYLPDVVKRRFRENYTVALESSHENDRYKLLFGVDSVSCFDKQDLKFVAEVQPFKSKRTQAGSHLTINDQVCCFNALVSPNGRWLALMDDVDRQSIALLTIPKLEKRDVIKLQPSEELLTKMCYTHNSEYLLVKNKNNIIVYSLKLKKVTTKIPLEGDLIRYAKVLQMSVRNNSEVIELVLGVKNHILFRRISFLPTPFDLMLNNIRQLTEAYISKTGHERNEMANNIASVMTQQPMYQAYLDNTYLKILCCFKFEKPLGNYLKVLDKNKEILFKHAPIELLGKIHEGDKNAVANEFIEMIDRSLKDDKVMPSVSSFMLLNWLRNPNIERTYKRKLLEIITFEPLYMPTQGQLKDELNSVNSIENFKRTLDWLEVQKDPLFVKGSADTIAYDCYRTSIEFNLTRGSKFSLEYFGWLQEVEDSELVHKYKGIIYYKWSSLYPFALAYSAIYWIITILLTAFLGFQMDSLAIGATVIALNIAIILFEIKCASLSFAEYMNDWWNITDFFSQGFCLVSVVILLRAYAANSGVLPYGFNWLRLLAFLFISCRALVMFRVFKGTRYLIFMLFGVFNKLGTFLSVFFYLIFIYWFICLVRPNLVQSGADNDLYNSIAEALNVAFSNFDANQKQPIIVATMVIAEIVLALVLFNFLIAIVSNTYDEYYTNKDIHDIRVLLNLIIKFDTFFNIRRGESNSNLKRYFIVLPAEEKQSHYNEVRELINAEKESLEKVLDSGVADAEKYIKKFIETKIRRTEYNFKQDLRKSIRDVQQSLNLGSKDPRFVIESESSEEEAENDDEGGNGFEDEYEENHEDDHNEN